MSGITVGIDGSPNSHRALDWAVQVRAASGFPAEELIGASKDSDLVALGARGGGAKP